MDRKKLLECAVGSDKFFLGTDSAPHAVERKDASCGCACCFTAHAAIEIVAEASGSIGRLDASEAFVSQRGAAFYGLPSRRGAASSSDSLRLYRIVSFRYQ